MYFRKLLFKSGVFYCEKGFIPAGRDKSDAEVNADCSSSGTEYFCFEKIMRNGWEIPKENRW